MKRTTMGLDIAKRVFQAHAVDPESGEVRRTKLHRSELLRHLAQMHPALVVMEACSGAQHWAREIRKLGHEVKLISPQFVRPFVKTNKTDAADAQAIWTAAQQPEMRSVAVKTEEQQAVLALHDVRTRLQKSRTAAINQLHGLMGEFGVELPRGWRKMLPKAATALDSADSPVPALLQSQLRFQIMEIRGSFRSGREFAAFLGLVPRQSGTGGRVRLLGISKRGDRYLRTLLIHGARCVLSHRHVYAEPNTWLGRLAQRRHANVAAVALANKMARQIWALLAHGRIYESKHGVLEPGEAPA